MPILTHKECDITDCALASGLADQALRHYNRAMPWGAKTRRASKYSYIVRMSSQDHCTLWMRKRTKEDVMYFAFNKHIGALTSDECDRTLITQLNEVQLECIYAATQQILEARFQNDATD
jgi:hypothetical protein